VKHIKSIKIFESKELFHEVDMHEYADYEFKRISNDNIKFILDKITSPVFDLEISEVKPKDSPSINFNSIKFKKYTGYGDYIYKFWIYEMEDEYFVFEVSLNSNMAQNNIFYKCDQKEGLVQCLKKYDLC
jgi:hypothetical protein